MRNNFRDTTKGLAEDRAAALSHYFNVDRDVIEAVANEDLAQDEIAVVFWVARQTRTDPAKVATLRARDVQIAEQKRAARKTVNAGM